MMQPHTPTIHPIQWSEGMLLSPQHFQQNQIYWESLLRHQMEQVLPFYWGLQALELDENALLAGMVKIQLMQAVMPDGLIVVHDAERHTPLELDLTPALSKLPGKVHKVYLAVPIRKPGAASSNAMIQRFDSYRDEPTVDDNTGQGQVSVERLRPRLVLMAGVEPSPQYSWIPLFEIQQDDDGAFKPTSYVPPLLQVRRKPFLGTHSIGEKVSQVAYQLRDKVLNLAKSSSAGSTAGASLSLEQRQRIHQMVVALPELEVLIGSDAAHPFAVYQSLARLLGQMSFVAANPVPSALPPYQHNDVGPGMEQALRFVQGLLNEIQLAYSTEMWTEEKTGVFSFPVPENWEGDRILVELQGSAERSLQDFQTWMAGCRIASVSIIKSLIRQRMPGASAEFLARDDHLGVVSAPGRALFEIKLQEGVVQAGEKLYIANTRPDNLEKTPTAILLYIPRESGS